MKVKNYEIFDVHAEFCKTLANPKRLIIIRALKDGEKTVGQFAEILDLPIANVSQHLKALRDRDVVATRKEGQKVYYSLTEPRLVEACELIREVIVEINKRRGKMLDFDESTI